MEPQHSRYVLNSGKGNIPFLFIVMFNNIDNHHQTNNSSLMATLIHDTDRMSSLEIAELTGKRHDAILRDIRNLLKQGVSHHNFVETSYKQPQPRGGYKELPCFELTKKGCLILASGYTHFTESFIFENLNIIHTIFVVCPFTHRNIKKQHRTLEDLSALFIYSQLYGNT